jgi:hypothetical protein
MDIQIEKLNLIKWLTDVEDASVIKQFIDLKNEQEPHGAEEWDLLTEYQKAHILKGLAEADAGLGTPAKEVIERVREKYRLNG